MEKPVHRIKTDCMDDDIIICGAKLLLTSDTQRLLHCRSNSAYLPLTTKEEPLEVRVLVFVVEMVHSLQDV